jgi:hypothetical protein
MTSIYDNYGPTWYGPTVAPWEPGPPSIPTNIFPTIVPHICPPVDETPHGALRKVIVKALKAVVAGSDGAKELCGLALELLGETGKEA